MPDAFLATLKEFERVVAEIGETRERLQALETARDQLRKQLRALAGTVEVTPTSTAGESGSGATHAIATIVDAVRALGGSARLADIARYAALDSKVAATRLQRAVQMHLLQRVAHGQYQLPPEELQKLISGTEVSHADGAASTDAIARGPISSDATDAE